MIDLKPPIGILCREVGNDREQQYGKDSIPDGMACIERKPGNVVWPELAGYLVIGQWDDQAIEVAAQ